MDKAELKEQALRHNWLLFDDAYDEALVGSTRDMQPVYDWDTLVSISMRLIGGDSHDAIDYVDHTFVGVWLERGPIVMYGANNT